MGEAKRRKKLDPSYGKVHNLKDPNLRDKHVVSIMNDFVAQLKPDLKILITAEYIPHEYEQIKERISDWLEARLSSYDVEDQILIARSLIALSGDMNVEAFSSPSLFVCVMEALKPYLPADMWSKVDRIADTQGFKEEWKSTPVTDTKTASRIEQ